MNTYMPSHADSSVNQVARAYQGNPQALEQRTQATNGMTPELIDLLAYQKLQADKKQAANQMALSAGQQPTVAQGMKDEAMSSAREEVTKSMGLPGLMQSAQGAPQPQGAQPQQPPQGAGLPGAQSNLPQQYQSGGIVAFGEGGPAPKSSPEEEQRTSDQAAMSDLWEQAKRGSKKALAILTDSAMMIPRGVVGAYDTAVVRPMRALGADASYLSPHLRPEGSEPNSPTPNLDKNRAQEAAATTNPTYDLDARPEATPAQPAAPARPAPAPRNQGLGGTQPGQARQAATPQTAQDVPMDVLKAKLLAGVNRDLDKNEEAGGIAGGKRYEDTVGKENLAAIAERSKRTEGLRALQEKQAGERPSDLMTLLQRMGQNTHERGLGGAFKGTGAAVDAARAGYRTEDVKNMGSLNALLDEADKARKENNIGKLKAIESSIDDIRSAQKAAQTTGASLITHDEATKARMQIADTARKAAAALAGVNATERKDRLAATVARAEEQQAMNLAMKAATEIMKTPLGLTKYKDRSAEDLAAETYPKILAQLRGQAPAPADGDNKVFSAADAILNKGKK